MVELTKALISTVSAIGYGVAEASKELFGLEVPLNRINFVFYSKQNVKQSLEQAAKNYEIEMKKHNDLREFIPEIQKRSTKKINSSPNHQGQVVTIVKDKELTYNINLFLSSNLEENLEKGKTSSALIDIIAHEIGHIVRREYVYREEEVGRAEYEAIKSHGRYEELLFKLNKTLYKREKEKEVVIALDDQFTAGNYYKCKGWGKYEIKISEMKAKIQDERLTPLQRKRAETELKRNMKIVDYMKELARMETSMRESAPQSEMEINEGWAIYFSYKTLEKMADLIDKIIKNPGTEQEFIRKAAEKVKERASSMGDYYRKGFKKFMDADELGGIKTAMELAEIRWNRSVELKPLYQD